MRLLASALDMPNLRLIRDCPNHLAAGCFVRICYTEGQSQMNQTDMGGKPDAVVMVFMAAMCSTKDTRDGKADPQCSERIISLTTRILQLWELLWPFVLPQQPDRQGRNWQRCWQIQHPIGWLYFLVAAVATFDSVCISSLRLPVAPL